MNCGLIQNRHYGRVGYRQLQSPLQRGPFFSTGDQNMDMLRRFQHRGRQGDARLACRLGPQGHHGRRVVGQRLRQKVRTGEQAGRVHVLTHASSNTEIGRCGRIPAASCASPSSGCGNGT